MAEQTISITVNGEAKEVEADHHRRRALRGRQEHHCGPLNGELRDLCTPLHDGDAVEPIALDCEDGLGIMRHSATHVMAQAVQELFPTRSLASARSSRTASTTISRSTTPFTPDDLKEIEKRMQRIIKSSQSFRRRVVTEEEALEEEADQPFKIELIEGQGSAPRPGRRHRDLRQGAELLRQRRP